MNNKRIRTFAPATIANVGPGFDILGVAINEPGDFVTAEITESCELTFSLKKNVTTIPDGLTNVAAHVAQLMLEELKPPYGISLQLDKQMPIGSGLGSSGASSAAAALAVNALLPKPLPRKELIRFAMEGERLATGAAHADNVAPSLLGGICLIRSYDPLDVIQLPFDNRFFWVVAHPHLIINTRDARHLLPDSIPLSLAARQNGNLATLITGLALGDATLISRSLDDYIAEPVRAPLIPGYHQVKKAALASGAIGFSISGSGPAVFALTTSLKIATETGKVIKDAFKKHAEVACDIHISLTNTKGAKILE